MAQFPSSSSASGRWKPAEARRAVKGSNWPSLPIPVEYLIIAGGGGGGFAPGNTNGGGGGAGG